MRVNKMYCDLCGVDIESEEELNKLVTDFYVKTNGKNFDLCNECAQKLGKQWKIYSIIEY